MRKATVSDINAIREMALVVFRETYGPILSPEQIDYMLEWMYSEESLRRQILEEGNVFFLEDGKGYVSVRPDGSSSDGRARFHLEKLYVMPSFRKSGLGKILFSRAVDEARTMAHGKPFVLELNVNRDNPAVGFYERMGMRLDSSGDFPIGMGYFMNDYIMAEDFQ